MRFDTIRPKSSSSRCRYSKENDLVWENKIDNFKQINAKYHENSYIS